MIYRFFRIVHIPVSYLVIRGELHIIRYNEAPSHNNCLHGRMKIQERANVIDFQER